MTLSNTQPPKSNLTREERRALSSLSRDETITILPADKGRCTVILNSADYNEKVISLLEDIQTSEKLKRDPINIYKKKVIDCLKHLGMENAIDNLYPGEIKVGQSPTQSLYGQSPTQTHHQLSHNIARHLGLCTIEHKTLPPPQKPELRKTGI
uniref:Uncharacterized protein n=1 Tax=Denticeps clupeoides TaxID=299321 RepID=A0AAY4AEL6_9TELE